MLPQTPLDQVSCHKEISCTLTITVVVIGTGRSDNLPDVQCIAQLICTRISDDLTCDTTWLPANSATVLISFRDTSITPTVCELVSSFKLVQIESNTFHE